MKDTRAPALDFEPLFFVLDKKCKWVMAVRVEDKYELRGVFIAYQGTEHGYQVWPACMGKSSLLEYSPTYEFTKNQDEAIRWAYDHSGLPDTNNVQRERIEDFPAY